MRVPKEGDIILCDFSPTKGHEQKGERPAVVVSLEFFNKTTKFVLVAPVTKTVRNDPFEVKIDTKNTKGVALVYQIRMIDMLARDVKVLDAVSETVMKEIVEKLESIYKK
jgi:mRNA interferase MazF